jgi:hypothetical protein
MDPITLMVTAITAGAAAALKPTAEQAVKDAYAALKTIIRDRYRRATERVESVEADPKSAEEREKLHTTLEQMHAHEDYEAVVQAQHVLEAVSAHNREVAAEVNISLEDIEVGANALIERVSGRGVQITIRRAKIGNDLTISGADATGRRPSG